MAWSFLRPKQPQWMLWTGVVSAVSLGIYLLLSWLAPWQPGRFWGLTFGILAALIFFLDALYPARRRLLSWPLGTAQRWLQSHVYTGLVACLFVFIHTGFRWPAGQMGWWLLGLSVWVTATGVLGVWLQKWIPTVISDNLSVEAIHERIPEMIERLQEEADGLLEDASDALGQIYHAEIREALAEPRPTWAHLVDLRSGRDELLEPLAEIEPFVDDSERQIVDDLETIVVEKLELDAHMSLQRALHGWLVLHAPPAMVLLGLIVVHAFAVWLL